MTTTQALQHHHARRLLRLHGTLYAAALVTMLMMVMRFRMSLPPYVTSVLDRFCFAQESHPSIPCPPGG
jgi:hypothetical protein